MLFNFLQGILCELQGGRPVPVCSLFGATAVLFAGDGETLLIVMSRRVASHRIDWHGHAKKRSWRNIPSQRQHQEQQELKVVLTKAVDSCFIHRRGKSEMIAIEHSSNSSSIVNMLWALIRKHRAID
jgi:hypothetical protein